MKAIATHQPCDTCGSSDALAFNEDGSSKCFSCGTFTPSKTKSRFREIPKGGFTALAERKISSQTCEKYGVFTDNGAHVYPYFDTSNHHVANKVRPPGPKSFMWEGASDQAGLFGMNVFPPGSAKTVTIVEGECDAMAAFEMNGSRYPVVSVHNAQSASKNVAKYFEYLNSFENIVVCFDKDEPKVNPTTGAIHYPGQEAAVAVASMFPIGKVRILTLAKAKDANDYLINGWSSDFTSEWWKAPAFTPTGLKLGRDMWDEISEPKNYETIPYPWETLNNKTYGIRLSELVILTAQTGIGKTSLLKEIEHHTLSTTDKGVGLLHLEEPNSDTALGLMSITANKPLHLPDVRANVTKEELREYFDKTVNNDRVVIWDHFGSNSIHEVLAKIRHMANLGCKYIILDHLSIVVSDQSGDERKELDEISTKLKTLCMELNISVIAVIHQNRNDQIRGSAGVEQLANMVIKLHRDKEDPDEWRRNVTKLVIQKNRFCGITGPASYLFYNPTSGRLEELTDPEVRTFEAGGTLGEVENW